MIGIIIIVVIVGFICFFYFDEQSRTKQMDAFCTDIDSIVKGENIDQFIIAYHYDALNKKYSLCMYYNKKRYEASFRVPSSISNFLRKLMDATNFDYNEIQADEVMKDLTIPLEARPHFINSSYTRSFRFFKQGEYKKEMKMNWPD